MSEPESDGARRIAELKSRLGHPFRDESLLQLALAHSSAVGNARSNQRLEFLGDRVLGLVVAHLLYERFPHEPEGALARRYSALVRRQSLAIVASSIGLGECIDMARGEEESGGRTNPALLADACEALLAALFLDGGLEAAEIFVRNHWQRLVEESRKPPMDPKTALQELAQADGRPLPVYREIDRHGPPHAPSFLVEVEVAGFRPERASGNSKRHAEKAAAQALLDRIRPDDDG